MMILSKLMQRNLKKSIKQHVRLPKFETLPKLKAKKKKKNSKRKKMDIKNFKNFASQKPSFTSRIPLRLASPTSKNIHLENEHNIKMNKMLDVNERDYSGSYKSNDSCKHNYEDDKNLLVVQVHENERSSFNTKVQQLLHKDKKSKTPIVRNNTEKD